MFAIRLTFDYRNHKVKIIEYHMIGCELSMSILGSFQPSSRTRENFMKFKQWVMPAILIFVVLFFTNASADKSDDKNKPKAYFPENTFAFDRTLEGTHVVHDFVIKNIGTAPLAVERVKST